MYEGYYKSPVGILKVVGDDVIHSVSFVESEEVDKINGAVRECIMQLDEYFRGERKDFSVPILFDGSAFQETVWRTLCEIPYGEVRTYGNIAKSIGNPGAMRAVGGANNKNKIAIIVPCHRVVNSTGLGGYATGPWKKEWLLKHEKHFKC
ncbi:MAG: methylated-DNA--[protein]-cysteine S-methyltransferase [Candidatus Nanoarchaeia archaeon]